MAERSEVFDAKAEVKTLVAKMREGLAARELAEARAVTPAQLAAERRVTAVVVKRLEAAADELAVIVEKAKAAAEVLADG